MVQLSTFVRTPTKQVLAGLNTGGEGQMFCVVWYKSLTTYTLLVGDLNYSWTSLCCTISAYIISELPSFSECDFFFFFFFFANLLGLGLTRILLPPFMLYL